MRVVVIGGVAAGTKAAAKIKRENRSAQVDIYTKSSDISYAGCGLPYYVGGDIATRDELIVNTPEKFASLTGASVHIGQEATEVDSKAKTVVFKNAFDGTQKTVEYDKLIIASGASPIIPNIDGVKLEGVFAVRTPDDAIAMRDYIEKNNCKKAVVVGAGFIGMEMAENLMAQNLSVTVVDMEHQILPNILDPEIAGYAARNLRKLGMKIMTGTTVSAIKGDNSVTGVLTSSGELQTDIVVLSIGIRPSTDFVANTGIEMIKGAIVVDEYQKSSIDDIYAAGDCAIVKNRITDKP
ncbi:MAG: FAD/NAD(P)-binding oxidoreductase, partial [Monoglobaceae bacterium]